MKNTITGIILIAAAFIGCGTDSNQDLVETAAFEPFQIGNWMVNSPATANLIEPKAKQYASEDSLTITSLDGREFLATNIPGSVLVMLTYRDPSFLYDPNVPVKIVHTARYNKRIFIHNRGGEHSATDGLIVEYSTQLIDAPNDDVTDDKFFDQIFIDENTGDTLEIVRLDVDGMVEIAELLSE